MPSGPIQVAIVGTGGIARVHAAALRPGPATAAVGRRPPVAPGESRRTLALVAAIYAAAFTGQPVTPRTPVSDNGRIETRWL